MDHLLFFIFTENFLVKKCLCIHIHCAFFNTAKFPAKNKNVNYLLTLNFIKQLNGHLVSFCVWCEIDFCAGKYRACSLK